MTRTRYSIASPFDDWKLVGRWKPDLRRYLVEELELIRSAFTCYDNYQGYLNYEREGRSVGFQENRRQPKSRLEETAAQFRFCRSKSARADLGLLGNRTKQRDSRLAPRCVNNPQ